MREGEQRGPAPPLLVDAPWAPPLATPATTGGRDILHAPPEPAPSPTVPHAPGPSAAPADPGPFFVRHGTPFKALADLSAAAAALVLGLLLLAALSTVSENSLDQLAHNLSRDWLVPVCVMVALMLAGFYRSSRRTLQANTFSELKDLAFAIGAGGVLALAISVIGHGVLQTPELPSAQVIVIVLVSVMLVAGVRGVTRTVRRNVVTSHVLLVGSGHLANQLQAYLELVHGVRVVGRVTDTPVRDAAAIGTLADLPELCRQHHVDHVLVGFPADPSPESVEILRTLQDQVRISIIPRYFELISWRSRLDDLFGLPILDVAPRHLSRWDRVAKRTLDLVAATMVLVVLSPVLLLIGAVVKLTSRGPVLFRQTRVGRDRRPFTIYKFRTMREPTAPDSEPRAPASGDDLHAVPHQPLHQLRHKAAEQHRITAPGRFLRKTSLDELPQFFNVLRGEMSLVGPRPFVPHESSDHDGWRARRYEVRPGITGLWQVSGRNALSGEDLERLDYLYVTSWSLWWDLKIMWDTPKTMVGGVGAW